jgi:hypothetical protein
MYSVAAANRIGFDKMKMNERWLEDKSLENGKALAALELLACRNLFLRWVSTHQEHQPKVPPPPSNSPHLRRQVMTGQ